MNNSPPDLSSIDAPFFSDLAKRSNNHPVLLVFLRHFGCIFCRELVTELSELRPTLNEMDIELAFVHVGTDQASDEFFTRFKLPKVARFSDPQSEYYEKFGLKQMTLAGMVSFATIAGSIRALKSGGRQGKTEGNPKMMPGLFFVSHGKIVRSFIHKSPGDKPDIMAFVKGRAI